MTLHDIFLTLSLLSQFAVIYLVRRAGQNRALSLALSLFLGDAACMQLATLLTHQTGSSVWRVADLVLTALAPALAVHVVAAFVGMPARDARVARVSYAASSALAAVTASAWWNPEFLPALESFAWTAAFLALWVVQAGYMGVRLYLHRRASAAEDERTQTRVLMLAFAVGAVGVSTELLPEVGVPTFEVGAQGLWLMSVLLGWLALRHSGAFQKHHNAASAAQLSVVVVGALAVASVAALSPHREWVIVVCAAALAAGVGLAVRESTQRVATHEEGRRRVMLLGAYAEQMAHDLRNPLAAVSGAVEELLMDTDAMPPDGRALLELVGEQARRMNAMLDDYRLLGSTELRLQRVSLNEICVHAARSWALAAGPAFQVKTELCEALPLQTIDPDQVLRVLENILRNASDACAEGGELLLRTIEGDDGTVAIHVVDRGVGMAPHEIARAFDEFYSTKT